MRHCLILFTLLFLITGCGAGVSPERAIADSKKELEDKFEQQRINNSLLTDTASGTVPIRQLIGNSPKLIMKFSDQSCHVCVDDILHKLDSAADKIGRENIIILSSYVQYRNFYIFYKKYGSRFAIYNMKEKPLGLKTEEYDKPFLVKVDTGLIATHLFVPFTETPVPTEEYLMEIESFFRSDNIN